MKIKSTILFFVIVACGVSQAEEKSWKETLADVSTGIVSIKIDSPRAFDTEWNSSSQATGFVVDAELGLIITNRHVVTPGPVKAEALFLNNEEVELKPIYRDPVHDFGIFKYNPKELKYIQPNELKFATEVARIGQEIRVIGNDAGEKLSILAGTIARLDRQAPDYGRGNYNDFNTFYYQAASGTSGGSSGSPVININGEVVALNAGGNNNSSSSFFFPPARVERALKLIQQNQVVKRGSLQTEFVRLTFDELGRLGLSSELEQQLRENINVSDGMLVAQRIINNAEIAKFIEPGDILLRLNEVLITDFITLADILDENVGRDVTIEINRGGSNYRFMINVTDLHDITPDAYLTFGDSVFNNFSYQQARHYNIPIMGMYVADPGYSLSKSGVPRGAVIFEVDGELITNIEDFKDYLLTLTDENKINLRFVRYSDPVNSVLRSVEIDRTWFESEICRAKNYDAWSCETLDTGSYKAEQVIRSASFIEHKEPLKNFIHQSLVHVSYDLPYPVAGIMNRHYYGTGVLVDKTRGLIIVDRNTVPVAIGDIRLTFAGSLEVPGRVEYIHPLHNLALLSFDPKLIGQTPVRAATFSRNELKAGDNSWLSGLKLDHQLFHQQITVASVDPLNLPPSINFSDSNIEVIDLVSAPDDIYGVLTDKKGQIEALWTSFSYRSGGESYQMNRGISSELVNEFIDQFQAEKPLYSLELDLGYIPLFSARKLGLSDDWISQFEEQSEKRRVIIVNNRLSGSSAAEMIQNGDLILAIDGQLVTSFRDYEKYSQSREVTVTLWRQNVIQEVIVSSALLNGKNIDHVLIWAGAHLHTPHRAIAKRGIDTSGVYVAFSNYGSPATRYGLNIGQRIIAVDGIDTPNLESFIEQVENREDRTSVKLKVVSWNGRVNVITMKLDNEFWAPYQLKKSISGWERAMIN